MQSGFWARLIGYEPALLDRISAGAVAQLALLGEAWSFSSTLLALPLGYGLWLVGHSLWGAALGALAMGAFVVNLLRLSAAAGGAAPHFEGVQVRAHRPAWGPTVFIGFLALLMAQLAQLPLHRAALDPQVDAYRKELVLAHERSRSALGLDDDGRYQRELAHSEFVVLRLRGMWQRPERTVRYTLFYCLLVLAPAFVARVFALGALREYERHRHQRNRRLIQNAERETAALVAETLSAWPSYRAPRARFADAPFNSVPSRLLLETSRLSPPPARRAWWRRP